jgi:hypothetical protein
MHRQSASVRGGTYGQQTQSPTETAWLRSWHRYRRLHQRVHVVRRTARRGHHKNHRKRRRSSRHHRELHHTRRHNQESTRGRQSNSWPNFVVVYATRCHSKKAPIECEEQLALSRRTVSHAGDRSCKTSCVPTLHTLYYAHCTLRTVLCVCGVCCGRPDCVRRHSCALFNCGLVDCVLCAMESTIFALCIVYCVCVCVEPIP